MKLFLMGYKVQNQLQQKEFIAAQTINDAIEYIQDEDCEVFGFSPNMVEELGTVYIAPAERVEIEAKVLKFENDDKS